MKRINRDGPRVLGDAVRPPEVGADVLARALEAGETVVDARAARDYSARAIPGTVNVPANRSFVTWSGALVPYDRDFYLLVDDRGTGATDLVRALAGIGLDRVAGVAGPSAVDAWAAAGRRLQSTATADVRDVARIASEGGATLLDVRSRAEWVAGRMPDALNVPLAELPARLGELPRGPLVLYCQTGARAAIAASLLMARGRSDVQLYGGGFSEWSAAGREVRRGEAVPS